MQLLQLILAIIPSIILFIVVWRSDKVEKEPVKLLVKLFLFGTLFGGTLTIISYLESKKPEINLLSKILPEPSSVIYMLILNFLIIALIEEAGKFIVLKKITWKDPAFNYIFDAVVYSVTVSLGFATVENIIYIITRKRIDIDVAIDRGLLAVPAHVIYAIYMGYFYGLAKHSEAIGGSKSTKKHLIMALVFPVLIHGLFDISCDTGQVYHLRYAKEILLIFEWLITIPAVIQIRRLHVEIPSDTAIEEHSLADTSDTEVL